MGTNHGRQKVEVVGIVEFPIFSLRKRSCEKAIAERLVQKSNGGRTIVEVKKKKRKILENWKMVIFDFRHPRMERLVQNTPTLREILIEGIRNTHRRG